MNLNHYQMIDVLIKRGLESDEDPLPILTCFSNRMPAYRFRNGGEVVDEDIALTMLFPRVLDWLLGLTKHGGDSPQVRFSKGLVVVGCYYDAGVMHLHDEWQTWGSGKDIFEAAVNAAKHLHPR